MIKFDGDERHQSEAKNIIYTLYLYHSELNWKKGIEYDPAICRQGIHVAFPINLKFLQLTHIDLDQSFAFSMVNWKEKRTKSKILGI